MRIAVTGVSGFIGSYLVRGLKASGHSVTGLVRATSRREHIEGFVDRFVVGEHDDERCWPALLEGADCVVHNSVDWVGRTDPPADLERHLRSNLAGSIRLLHASSPGQFVFISSIAVHHDMRPRWKGLIDEDHPLRPKSVYGAYKAAVEAYLWAEHLDDRSTGGQAASGTGGRHTCAIRPCGVYGIDPDLARSHGYDELRALARGEAIRTPGGGKWVHVDDVVALVAAVIGNPAAAGRPFNMVDCYARYADWGAAAAEVLGIKAEIDFSSPAKPQNEFSKEAAASLGVRLDRGIGGIREHLRELAAEMRRAGALP
jgi:nucleoside-diphosphate-sugar epimerase